MKVRYLMTLAAVAALAAWMAPAMAFHSGGVAECEGCHSMHEAGAEPLLFNGMADQSSVCLRCHQSTTRRGYYIATTDPTAQPPQQATPGGDFSWLKLSYQYTARPGSTRLDDAPGYHKGHNIVSATYGYVADTSNGGTAPGGDMLADDLKCTSCHDPHSRGRRVWNGTNEEILSPYAGGLGNVYPPISGSGSYNTSWDLQANGITDYSVGVYRLLGVDGYRAYGTGGGTLFGGAPMAVVNSTYNRLEYAAGAESPTRVAYGHSKTNGFNSWSEWCGTCHTDYHNVNGPEELKHPTETLLGTDIQDNYNAYKKTGDLTGVQGTSFSSLTPFAENTADFATLAGKAVNGASAGPGGTEGSGRMACTTCHRAHASAWSYGLRWNYEWEFLTLVNSAGTVVYPASDSTDTRIDNGNNIADYGAGHRGYDQLEMEAAYYGRPADVFAGFQRQLCNKCHIQD